MSESNESWTVTSSTLSASFLFAAGLRGGRDLEQEHQILGGELDLQPDEVEDDVPSILSRLN